MAEMSPEAFVLAIRRVLEQRAAERDLQGASTGLPLGGGDTPPGVVGPLNTLEVNDQFIAFLASSRLWADAMAAASVTDAINILVNNVFPSINAEDPFDPGFGQTGLAGGISQPLISSSLDGFVLIRNALTPTDSDQAADHTAAIRDSVIGQTFDQDTLSELGGALDVSLDNLLTVPPPPESFEAGQEAGQREALARRGLTEDEIDEEIESGIVLLPDPGDKPFTIGPEGIPLPKDFRSTAPPDPFTTTADFLTGPSPLDLEIAERRRAGESLDEIRDDLNARRAAIRRGDKNVEPIPSSVPVIAEGLPRYFDQAAVHFLEDFSIETIASIQVMLVKSGLLGTDSFRPGLNDPSTILALHELSGMANISNQTWFAALRQAVRFSAPIEDGIRAAEQRAGPQSIFTPRAFRVPDPNTLAGQVLDTFNRFLGRDPSPEELAEFMNLLSSGTAASFSADEKARFLVARSTAEAQAEAFELLQVSEETANLDSFTIAQRVAAGESLTKIFAEIKAAGVQSETTAAQFDALLVADQPGTVAQVDPTATFLNTFRNRFGATIKAREEFDFKRAFDQSARQSTRSGFLGFLSMIRNNPFAPT